MQTLNCLEPWHGVVIAAVSLFLQASLLAALYCLFSRRLARHSERILKEVRSQDSRPSPDHHPSPATQEPKVTLAERSALVSDLHYRHGSDTSSDSSSSSSSSGSSPPSHQANKDMNYTQVVFPDPGGLKNETALDYENIKEAKDYVNVNPQIRKPNIWTFVNPDVSETVEYTQVAK
ncbi:regulator of hemoglobinization and erythroid cell expansion protein-like [Talpa occidentalis]|nr:regulator of hemoglobinization and erythroid cell expansion protein-like [Talpa occidentalis]